MRGEREKLLHMEDVLRKRVVGQDEAITASIYHHALPCDSDIFIVNMIRLSLKLCVLAVLVYRILPDQLHHSYFLDRQVLAR